MLYQLDAALLAAAQDRSVRVIIVAAEGPDFSAGHDLSADFVLPCAPVASMEGDIGEGGAEGHYSFEQEAYLGLCRRWRELPKPTIAEVHGRCIAGGLMVVWPLDLIVAAQSATFADPVAAFGVNGVEYFLHPWEVGARKAKEMLFTGDPITAEEARQLGMVNRVVPDEDLTAECLRLARQIAGRPAFGLRLAKQSVNRALDAQGQRAAVDAAFALHHVGHANNLAKFGQIIDPSGSDLVRQTGARMAEKASHRTAGSA
jgi:enoyl-CoA hydratase